MKSEDLRMGMRVLSNREFSGVPKGTLGEVVERSNSWPDVPSVAIEWCPKDDDVSCLTDWFSFDDLEYLDIARPDTYDPTTRVEPRDDISEMEGG